MANADYASVVFRHGPRACVVILVAVAIRGVAWVCVRLASGIAWLIRKKATVNLGCRVIASRARRPPICGFTGYRVC